MFTALGDNASGDADTLVFESSDNLDVSITVTNAGAASGSNTVTFSSGLIASDAIHVELLDAIGIINVGSDTDLLGGSEGITLKASRNIVAAGSITTSGTVTLEANQQATPTAGNFAGIHVSGASITSEQGDIVLRGRVDLQKAFRLDPMNVLRGYHRHPSLDVTRVATR